MHNRKEIIGNQALFREEIINFLKEEFNEMKNSLNSIKTKEKKIMIEKVKLSKKISKIKVMPEIERYLISFKNVYPKYYAWWDEENEEVIKHKYEDL